MQRQQRGMSSGAYIQHDCCCWDGQLKGGGEINAETAKAFVKHRQCAQRLDHAQRTNLATCRQNTHLVRAVMEQKCNGCDCFAQALIIGKQTPCNRWLGSRFLSVEHPCQCTLLVWQQIHCDALHKGDELIN